MAAREVQPRSAILVHNLTTGSQSVVGCTEVVSASPDSRILVFQQLAANECITHFQGKVHIFLIIAFLEAHVLHLAAERLSREQSTIRIWREGRSSGYSRPSAYRSARFSCSSGAASPPSRRCSWLQGGND